MRLYHFSEEPDIRVFEPRPPPQGWQTLQEPVVWAVDEVHAPAYLFPRDCPRIICWLLPTTTDADRERWWGGRDARFIAHVEWAWLDAMRSTTLYRYEMPPAAFRPTRNDPWMWVSRETVRPLAAEPVGDLFEALRGAGVELRLMPSLLPLRGLWDTTLHTSGIRLRNARGWT
jgi:hypothetical protein